MVFRTVAGMVVALFSGEDALFFSEVCEKCEFFLPGPGACHTDYFFHSADPQQ
jgi:hypothetical protein